MGLGIYLPTSRTLMLVVGALVGWWFNRRAEQRPRAEAIKQLGVLLASGLIVGESLLCVAYSFVVVLSGRHAPIALVRAEFATASMWLGWIAFAGVMFALYRWVERFVAA